MTERTRSNTYRFTAPTVAGEMVWDFDRARYNDLRENVADYNLLNVLADYEPNRRWVVRKRYRGSRMNKPARLRQSMCNKADATSVDVYVFREWKGNR